MSKRKLKIGPDKKIIEYKIVGIINWIVKIIIQSDNIYAWIRQTIDEATYLRNK